MQWLEYCALHVFSAANSKSELNILKVCSLHFTFLLIFLKNNVYKNLHFQELDQTLRTRSYLLGDFLSLADIVMFYSIQSLMVKNYFIKISLLVQLYLYIKITFQPLINSSHRLLHVVRWYDHLQKNDSISRGNILINFNYLFI